MYAVSEKALFSNGSGDFDKTVAELIATFRRKRCKQIVNIL